MAFTLMKPATQHISVSRPRAILATKVQGIEKGVAVAEKKKGARRLTGINWTEINEGIHGGFFRGVEILSLRTPA